MAKKAQEEQNAQKPRLSLAMVASPLTRKEYLIGASADGDDIEQRPGREAVTNSAFRQERNSMVVVEHSDGSELHLVNMPLVLRYDVDPLAYPLDENEMGRLAQIEGDRAAGRTLNPYALEDWTKLHPRANAHSQLPEIMRRVADGLERGRQPEAAPGTSPAPPPEDIREEEVALSIPLVGGIGLGD